MNVAINAEHFQRLVDLRIADARVLVDAGRWDGAFYLAGYAVETALKAVIASRGINPFAFSPKHDFFIHDLRRLAQYAGLVDALDQQGRTQPMFQSYWNMVLTWSEQRRYSNEDVKEIDARQVVDAVGNNDGVVAWLKQQS